MIISLDAEKNDKMQHAFLFKVLERSVIQGPYLKHKQTNTTSQQTTSK